MKTLIALFGELLVVGCSHSATTVRLSDPSNKTISGFPLHFELDEGLEHTNVLGMSQSQILPVNPNGLLLDGELTRIDERTYGTEWGGSRWVRGSVRQLGSCNRLTDREVGGGGPEGSRTGRRIELQPRGGGGKSAQGRARLSRHVAVGGFAENSDQEFERKGRGIWERGMV